MIDLLNPALDRAALRAPLQQSGRLIGAWRSGAYADPPRYEVAEALDTPAYLQALRPLTGRMLGP